MNFTIQRRGGARRLVRGDAEPGPAGAEPSARIVRIRRQDPPEFQAAYRRVTAELEQQRAVLERRNRELAELNRLGALVASTLDREEILRRVVHTGQRLFGAGLVRPWLLDQDRTRLHLADSADPDRLRQVVGNLLTNAINYSPGGGEIVLRAWPDARQVWVSVTDQGVGIAADEQERVFEKFYRPRDAIVSTVRGSGLGLAAVRHLVQAHGGTIRLRSAPGQGSTFTFSLPLADVAARTPVDRSPRRRRPRRIASPSPERPGSGVASPGFQPATKRLTPSP